MRDHASAIEAHAVAVKCDRHIPHMRGCAWIGNQPCACRIAVDETIVLPFCDAWTRMTAQEVANSHAPEMIA